MYIDKKIFLKWLVFDANGGLFFPYNSAEKFTVNCYNLKCCILDVPDISIVKRIDLIGELMLNKFTKPLVKVKK